MRRNTKAPVVQHSQKLFFRITETSWGSFGVVFDATEQIVATFLPQPKEKIRRLIAANHPRSVEATKGIESFCKQIRDYFERQKSLSAVTINLSAVPDFRRKVLEACRRIPFGATASYADLARAAGSPGAARAVGSAMARNPLPLIIPCHRVLASDGTIGGFSSPDGIQQKERLLLLENPAFQVRKRRTTSRKRKLSPIPNT